MNKQKQNKKNKSQQNKQGVGKDMKFSLTDDPGMACAVRNYPSIDHNRYLMKTPPLVWKLQQHCNHQHHHLRLLLHREQHQHHHLHRRRSRRQRGRK